MCYRIINTRPKSPERANRASQNSKLGINWANIDQDRARMGDPIRNEMVTHFSACRGGYCVLGSIYTVVGEEFEIFVFAPIVVKVP